MNSNEIAVGQRVKVRGCPGFGVGTVQSVESTLRNVDGTAIPCDGFVMVRVDFGANYPDGRHVESFSSRDLMPVGAVRP